VANLGVELWSTSVLGFHWRRKVVPRGAVVSDVGVVDFYRQRMLTKLLKRAVDDQDMFNLRITKEVIIHIIRVQLASTSAMIFLPHETR